VMIDTLLKHRAMAERDDTLASLGLAPDGYALVTLHRPSNVDAAASFQALLDASMEATDGLPLVFPAHPRSAARLAGFGIELPGSVRTVEPLGYLDFVGLVDDATIVLTDSGGVQEETSVLGVRCVTLRESTERPITCELGTNWLTGTDPASVRATIAAAMAEPAVPAEIPLWDGHAGERIAAVLLGELAG